MERKKFIDIAKAICMTGVVFGHLAIWLPVSAAYENVVGFLHMYQMPFFFFISGMHLKLKDENPIGVFLAKRLKGVVKPFVIWCLILSAFQIITTSHIHKYDPVEILKVFVGPLVIEGNFVGSWFLPAFFWAQLLIAFALLFLKTKILYGAVIIIIGLTGLALPEILPENYYRLLHKFHHLDVAIAASGLIGLGTLVREKINYGNGFFALLSIAGLSISYYFNSYVDMNHSMYGSIPLYLLGAFSGIYLVLYISTKIEKHSVYLRTLSAYIGKNSLWILFFHGSIALFLSYIFGINKYSSVHGSVYLFYMLILILVPVSAMYIISAVKKYMEEKAEAARLHIR
ncbi:MAG TPA: acyltransferase [Ignavibacteriales bacterium]|nr:acyltransferase [Ignavibacteriales bacterium]HEX3074278.1 acyltransferase [Ignavibacteriales bacterium]